MKAGDFRLTCRRCRVVLIAVGPRLADEALRMVLEHVRSVHPSVGLSFDAQAGAILGHFDVVNEHD